MILRMFGIGVTNAIAGGQTYKGKRYVNWNKRSPVKGEKLTIYFEKENPSKFAVII